MYMLELIGRMIINLAKEVCLLPHNIALALQQKRWQTTRDQAEAERLDRIRQPWKYLGR